MDAITYTITGWGLRCTGLFPLQTQFMEMPATSMQELERIYKIGWQKLQAFSTGREITELLCVFLWKENTPIYPALQQN